jgi:vacuolar-type H+-ATPase subunit I/STV1
MDEIIDQLEEKEERIHLLEEEKEKLLESVEDLLEQKQEQEAKNRMLQTQIDELMGIMKESEKQIEQSKKNATLSDIKIEPKIYLKGMFESFIKERNALKIMIEGTAYYYPLDSYQCTHLPISGSRVLIFKSEQGENIIYGFNRSRLIESAKKVKAIIKFVSPIQNRLKLHIEEYGFINLEPSEDFWKDFQHKIGDMVILTKIAIDGDLYFYISEKGKSQINRNEILQILYKENR